jgi:branched-subunit amino acid ABC-type transport system permease component
VTWRKITSVIGGLGSLTGAVVASFLRAFSEIFLQAYLAERVNL